jgi:hypothetical protein
MISAFQIFRISGFQDFNIFRIYISGVFMRYFFVLLIFAVLCGDSIGAVGAGAGWLADVRAARERISRKIDKYNASVVFRSDVLRGGDAPVAVKIDVSGKKRLWLFTGDAGDGTAIDHSVWGNARVTGLDGEIVYLDSLKPIVAKVDYGKFRHGSVTIGGKSFKHGLYVHAKSLVGYALDKRFVSFEASIGINRSAKKRGSATFVCSTADENPDYSSIAEAAWRKLAEDYPEHYAVMLLDFGEADARRMLLRGAGGMQKGCDALRRRLREDEKKYIPVDSLAVYAELLEQVVVMRRVQRQMLARVPALNRYVAENSMHLSRLWEMSLLLGGSSAAVGTDALQRTKAVEEQLQSIELSMRSGNPAAIKSLDVIVGHIEGLADRFQKHLGWPMLRGNNDRSAISFSALAPQLNRIWTHRPQLAPAPAWPPPARENASAFSGLLSPSLTYD